LEGNYWSDYPGVDDGSGTGKHAIAGDGIGDTYIPWPGLDFDFYPLILSYIKTPLGTGVEVIDPVTEAKITFDEVTNSGTTTVDTSSTGPSPPAGFEVNGQYYEINTIANYTGTIIVCLPYNETLVVGNEADLQLMHWNSVSMQWEDITTWVDTVNNIICGEVSSLSPFVIMENLDFTPPTTALTIGKHYVDEISNIFVTSDTEFTLTAIDDYSGVAHIYYRINNGDWMEYIEAFTLVGQDGTYTIEYYSVDATGKDEMPKSVTVILVSLEVNSYVSDGDNNPISYFDVVFSKKNTGYQLVATNPGQIFYNIEIINGWPIAVDSLTIDANIPTDFVLKGARPIHVYLDGIDITDICTIDGTLIIVTDVPAGSMVYVNIHMDYALKGTTYESLDDFGMKDYIFEVSVSGSGGSPSIPGRLR
jgi:hypothetical protein